MCRFGLEVLPSCSALCMFYIKTLHNLQNVWPQPVDPQKWWQPILQLFNAVLWLLLLRDVCRLSDSAELYEIVSCLRLSSLTDKFCMEAKLLHH